MREELKVALEEERKFLEETGLPTESTEGSSEGPLSVATKGITRGYKMRYKVKSCVLW